MFKKAVLAVFLIDAVLLSGCATVNHVPLSKENSQAIKTVYVDPNIKKPEKMYEFVSGEEYTMAFGAVGGLIGGTMAEKSAQDTQSFAEKNNIDIRKIVYQNWTNQLNNHNKFKLAKKPSDTTLSTEVVVYGISIPHGFSTDYVPMLTLNAKLVRNNQVVWQDSERVLPLTSGMPRYKMDAILNDPKKLYTMWDKAAERVVSEMLEDINKA